MMRFAQLFSLLLLFQPMASYAQECYPFDDVPEGSPSMEELEMTYADTDTTGAFNPTKPYMPDMKGIGKKYRTFVSNLGSYLDSNGFKWDKRIRYFQRIYFGKDGMADYYLYEFKKDPPKEERRELFEKLIEEYLAKNSLGIETKGRFAMCAPVILKPSKDDGE